MIRIAALLVALFFAQAANATTYFVAQNGSDANNGTSAGTPFAHLKTAVAAAVAGDTVCVNDNATYTAASEGINSGAQAVLNITTSGTSGHNITFMACNGHTPLIQHGTGDNVFDGIRVGANYITVGPGFTVYGSSDQVTLAGCLSVTVGQGVPCVGNGIAMQAHDVIVTGNISHDNGSCGVCGSPFSFGTGATFDHLTISNNIIYNNSYYSFSGGSGISLYELTNSDTAAGYHIRITGNILWANRMYVNEGPCCGNTGFQQDGSNCIIDDGNHTQHTNQGAAYTGAVLVENNIMSYGGGTGCHAYETNNVDFFFNTFYHNLQSHVSISTHGLTANQDGELGACNAVNVRAYDNVIVADPGFGFSTLYSSSCATHGITADYNVRVGGPAGVTGAHDVTTDPKIANPIMGACANWHLHAGSPAIGAGNTSVTGALATDFYGVTRPNPPSIGAAEVSPLGLSFLHMMGFCRR